MHRKHEEDPWWADDPAVTPCRLCGCPIQNGATGMTAHFGYVHPEVLS